MKETIGHSFYPDDYDDAAAFWEVSVPWWRCDLFQNHQMKETRPVVVEEAAVF